MDKRRVTLKVMGKEYFLITDHSEEQLSRIAGYVDRRMRELSIVTRASDTMIPILTCMTLAEELLESENENKKLSRELSALKDKIEMEKQ